MGFPGGAVVKNLPAFARGTGLVPGQEHTLEEEMSTHSSNNAWKNPRTEELVGYDPQGHKESNTTEYSSAEQKRKLIWQDIDN